MNLINIIIGDYYKDGHGQTENFFIETNLSSIEIQKAYDLGSKFINFDLKNQVASNYSNKKIHRLEVEKLENIGLNLNLEPMYNEDPNFYYIDQDIYFLIYLFIVGLGAKDFNYKIVNVDKVKIGGCAFFD